MSDEASSACNGAATVLRAIPQKGGGARLRQGISNAGHIN